MKLKLITCLLLCLTSQVWAEERQSMAGYFKPVQVSNKQQYDYIKQLLIVYRAMADSKARTQQVGSDYDTVLENKAKTCLVHGINKTLNEFVVLNKKFADSDDQEISQKYLLEIPEKDTNNCSAISHLHFDRQIEKLMKKYPSLNN